MFRIILWKIGFEWAQLTRLLWPCTDRKIYYFAFGANLCTDILEQRRIAVYEAFDYVLDGAVLQFSQPGFYKNHGYASADACDGNVVYGKMYLILECDARRMDYFEGVPFLKAHERVFRETDEFSFYFYRTTRIFGGLKPTQEYLDYLVNAYHEMSNVPVGYIESMATTEVLEALIPSDDTGLFIREIDRWPDFMHPLLICYEVLCLRFTESLWNRSLVQWMIKN